MQVLRFLAARRPRRRAVPTTISAPAPPSEAAPESELEAYEDDDEGPFFDLDFSSVRASSSSSAGSSASGTSCDDAFTDLDFIISLHRSRSSASPSYDAALFLLKPSCCPSGASKGRPSGPRALSCTSFGAGRKAAAAALYGGRPSLARSSSSARSLRLFMESPADDDETGAAEKEPGRGAPYPPSYSGDAIRRYLASISRRLRLRRSEPGALRRLRKSRSASAAVSSSSRRDDSLVEKQDGIASAIAHCKESLSLHRASLSSECESPLPRSRSDPSSWPGKRDAAYRADLQTPTTNKRPAPAFPFLNPDAQTN